MNEFDFIQQMLYNKFLIREPAFKVDLAASFAVHNISPDGILETETWSESRNAVTTAIEIRGVTYKI